MIIVGKVRRKTTQLGMTMVVIECPDASLFLLCDPLLGAAFVTRYTYSFAIEHSQSDPVKKQKGKKG